MRHFFRFRTKRADYNVKENGRADLQRARSMVSSRFCLELETRGELHLPLTIDRIACRKDRAKGRPEIEFGAGKTVLREVDACDLESVEEVERLRENLDVRRLG